MESSELLRADLGAIAPRLGRDSSRARTPRPGDALMTALRAPRPAPDPQSHKEVGRGAVVLLTSMAQTLGDRALERACKAGRMSEREAFRLVLRLEEKTGVAARSLRRLERRPPSRILRVRRARELRPRVRRRSCRRSSRTSRAGPGDSEGEEGPAGGRSRQARPA